MNTVRDHYDEFLGSVYSWILGDFDTARQLNESFFSSLKLAPRDGAVAVDLGSGPGCQSLPLAELGYKVVAIDFCQSLIDELERHADALAVTAICDDISGFPQHLSEPPQLIVCMGDTLVHLPDEETVFGILDEVCESLAPGGRFIYAIRDYMSFVPGGAERFIPIRSSDDRIFACFLDYQADVVHVHDILHERHGDEWRMSISDYRKLRLDSAAVDARLVAGGLEIASRTESDGMLVGIAEKPR